MDLSSSSKFITAREASALTGYVADYITRQCRAGKIESKQVGRVWLIDEASLLAHFAEEALRKEKNAKELARQRELEYAEAKKKREEAVPVETPVESPYAPIPAHPSWFTEEVPARHIRGSFASLALTLTLLAGGLYAGLEETRNTALAVVHETGLASVRTALHLATALRGDGAERIFVRQTEEVHEGETEVHTLPVIAFELPELPHITPPKLTESELVIEEKYEIDTGVVVGPVVGALAEFGAFIQNTTHTILGVHEQGAYVFVETAQEVPEKIVTAVHSLGHTIASFGNQAPSKSIAFVRSLEGEALGVIGNIALVYDTTKGTIARAYDLRVTEPEESRQYAVRETDSSFVIESEPATYNLQASVGGSGALAGLEGVAVFTYETINGFFARTGNVFVSLFAPKEKEADNLQLVVDSAPEPESVATSHNLQPTSSPTVQATSYSSPIYNEYYTITATGVSREYVDVEIRRHIDNLDDRIDDRLDNVGGGGGGGSGSVTSVDISGGTTGLSFAGGPITSSGTFTLSGTLAIANGGTGIATAPTYGQLLMGNSLGGYDLVATSSLGISGSGGTPGGADGEVQFNQGGVFGAESAFSYASTTNTLSVTSGVIQSTSGIFRGDDEYHQIIFHNVGNRTDYFEWGDTLANNGGHRFYTGGPGFTLRAQIADDGSYFQGPVGVGTTSPWAQLSINPNGITGPAFAIGSSTATRFIVTNGGNVGIGTTTPNSLLTLQGGGIAISDTGGSGWSYFGRYDLLPASVTNGPGTADMYISGGLYNDFFIASQANGTNEGLRFGNTNFDTGVFSEYMTILGAGTGAGNVGIGTTTPTAKLSVLGTTEQLRLGYDSTNYANFTVSSAGNLTLGTTGSTGNMTFNVPNSGTWYWTIGGFGRMALDNSRLYPTATLDLGASGNRWSVLYAGLINANTVGNNYLAGNLGVGTTSPFAKTSIHANNGETNTTLFAVGSSTASATTTLFRVANTGAVITSSSISAGTSVSATQFTASDVNYGFVMPNLIYAGAGFNGSQAGIWTYQSGGFGWANANPLVVDTSMWRQSQGVVRFSNTSSSNANGTILAHTLGLGTTTPYAQLSIVATSTTGVGAPTTLFAIASTTQGTATTTLFSVLNNGNVGIGTSTPQSKLNIKASINDDEGAYTQGLLFTTNNNLAAAIWPNQKSGGYGELIFGTNSTGTGGVPTERVRIDKDGNVGIGTVAPGQTLQVMNASNFQARIGAGSTFNYDIGRNTTDGLLYFYGNQSGFTGYSFGGADGTRMVINSSGNIGIGTTSPVAKLSVVSGTNGVLNFPSGNWAAQIFNQDDNATSGGLVVGNRWLGSASSIFEVGSLYGTGSAWSSFFTVRGGGSVGVGTTSPTGLFNIYGGTAFFDNDTANADQIYIRGSTGTNHNRQLTIGYNTTGNYAAIQAVEQGVGYKDLILNGAGGNVGIGTSTPWRRLSVTDTSAQFVAGYDSERYTQFSTDSVGDLTIDPQGGDIFALDENLYICAGGACPSGAPSAAGTIVAETAIGIASSTPWAGLSLASGKALIVAENTLATSTSMTVDWRNGNQQLVRLGTAGTTISFSGYVEGQKLTLMVCNPNATAGAVSWGTQILWSGGSAPTQTTTANKCDVWSFLATQATSTVKIFGSQSANF